MDDLKQRCAKKINEVTVPSSKGDTDYRVVASKDPSIASSCECRGFEFRGQCKHLTAALNDICGWQTGDPEWEQTPQQEMMMQCPKCGEDTEMVSC